MQSDGNSKQDEPKHPVFRVFGVLPQVATALSVVAGIFVAIENHVTWPVAGCAFHSSVGADTEARDDDSTHCGYWIRNPGPGDLSGLKLVVRVPEEIEFPSLRFKTIKYEPSRTNAVQFVRSGDGTDIIVSPDGNGTLGPGKQFGLHLTSPGSKWAPSKVLIRINGDEDPADAMIPDRSAFPAWLRTLRWVPPIVTLLTAVGIWWYLKKLIPQEIERAVNARLVEELEIARGKDLEARVAGPDEISGQGAPLGPGVAGPPSSTYSSF